MKTSRPSRRPSSFTSFASFAAQLSKRPSNSAFERGNDAEVDPRKEAEEAEKAEEGCFQRPLKSLADAEKAEEAEKGGVAEKGRARR